MPFSEQPGHSLSNRLHSGRNRLEFALRNFLSLPSPPYREPAEDKTGLLQDNSEGLVTASRLCKRYDLSAVVREASRQRTLETLSYLEWLDHFASLEPTLFQQAFRTSGGAFRWLDVGAKNWAYVAALNAFIRAHTEKPFRLDGVELDPNRRYTDFRTRRQYAEAFAQCIPEAHYHPGDILHWRQPARIISHFLPFVLTDPLLAWGLPASHFQPQAMLDHLLTLLEPGGVLVIVNQGEAEAKAQEALFAINSLREKVRWKSLGQLPASFIDYKYGRYGWLCIQASASNR